MFTIRVTSATSFASTLQDTGQPVLPIWVPDGEAAQFSRAVGEALGKTLLALEPDTLFELPDPSHLLDGSDADLVLYSCPEDRPVAHRYAELTDRVCMLWDGHSEIKLSDGSAPHSVTWLPRLDEVDMAERLIEVRQALGGLGVPLGVITAQDERHRSWQMLKQLCPGTDDARTTRIALTRPSQPEEGVLGYDLSGAEVVEAVSAAEGTLLLAGHSRPYCAIANSTDGPVGFCGANSAGPGCVGEVRCHFGTAPRVRLDELRVGRAFLDGCTTAGVGGRDSDFPPRDSMVCHATLRSSVRELVGNTHLGDFGELDLDWFEGSSALGRSPAAAGSVVEVARHTSERETVPCLVYFGDARNPPWPVDSVRVGRVDATDDRVRIDFDGAAPVLIAELPSRSWAQGVTSGEVTFEASDVAASRVEIIADPTTDRSLLLASGRGMRTPDAAIAIELRRTPSTVSDQAGARAVIAYGRVRWMQDLAPFSECLSAVRQRMEQDILRLVHSETQQRSESFGTMLSQVAGALAQSADGELIQEAVSRSATGFRLQNAYAARMQVTPFADPRTCPRCGGSARYAELQDLIQPTVRRNRTTCGFCGVAEDLPEWPLELDWAGASLQPSQAGLTISLRIRNRGTEPRAGQVMACLNSVAVDENQPAPSQFSLGPGEEVVVVAQATAAEPVASYLAVRVYIASEGDFAVLAENRVVMVAEADASAD